MAAAGSGQARLRFRHVSEPREAEAKAGRPADQRRDQRRERQAPHRSEPPQEAADRRPCAERSERLGITKGDQSPAGNEERRPYELYLSGSGESAGEKGGGPSSAVSGLRSAAGTRNQ